MTPLKVRMVDINRRIVSDWLFRIILFIISALCAVPLVLILFFIVKKGISSINWGFLTHLPKPVGETGGGILNAITGSLLILIITAVIAIPIGFFAGLSVC